MTPVLPVDVLDVRQPEICLVHQGRRLQAVAGGFARHAGTRDVMEIPVNERDEFVQCAAITVSPFVQEAGDVGWFVSPRRALSLPHALLRAINRKRHSDGPLPVRGWLAIAAPWRFGHMNTRPVRSSSSYRLRTPLHPG